MACHAWSDFTLDEVENEAGDLSSMLGRWSWYYSVRCRFVTTHCAYRGRKIGASCYAFTFSTADMNAKSYRPKRKQEWEHYLPR